MIGSRALRVGAAITAIGLTGCAATATQKHAATVDTPCGSRAVQLIAQNVGTIASHRYADASIAAERAARISLQCSENETSANRFNDRWRGANALVVAAELAHQARQQQRAQRLLSEGYGIMHQLRPPAHLNALTSTLVAQTRDGAERDRRGQWSYW